VIGEAAVITLPAVPESIREAREFTEKALAGYAAGAVDIAKLLVSEATTNSTLHSDSRFGGDFTLTLDLAENRFRAEVVDDGAANRPTRRGGDEPRTSGYGLQLIERLAARSGHFTDPEGRLHVWFDLDWPQP
jgi:anti-sigma regulatory factor (Ser/Thr protein kinase)